MGRARINVGSRATQKVTISGSVMLHHRYIYRDCLQSAACDLPSSTHPCLWLITWAAMCSVASRPQVIQKAGRGAATAGIFGR